MLTNVRAIMAHIAGTGQVRYVVADDTQVHIRTEWAKFRFDVRTGDEATEVATWVGRKSGLVMARTDGSLWENISLD